jgi:hypothetical protein
VRRAAKKDETHNPIAEHLRNLGWSVLDLSRLGGGAPDMAVSRPGFAALLECKSKGGKLNAEQEAVRARWQGPYVVAWTPEQAAAELYIAWKGLE